MPQARRPVRRPAAMNACVRSRRTSHRRQAIPDRLSFCRQEAESLLKPSDPPFASLRLCAFALLGGRAESGSIWVICGQIWVGPASPLYGYAGTSGGSAPLRLCASAFFFCSPWCLGVLVVLLGGWAALCLCVSVVFLSQQEAQATGGRMVPELSNLTARLPVVHAMQAGADLMTCSTKTSSGM